MKKLISIEQFLKVFKRDAFSVLSSWIAFFLSMALVWHLLSFSEENLTFGALAAASGISLFLGVRLWAQDRRQYWLYSLVALFALLAFTFWHLPLGQIKFFRFLHWFLICHLLIATAPLAMWFRNPAQAEIQIWRFNWYVLTRFIFGIVFCVAMVLGLFGALALVKTLFSLNISSEYFFTVFLAVFFVVSVVFVLSTIDDTHVGPQSDQVSTDLRRLIQYLLTPMALIYFALAYAYIIKILLSQSWPQGVVGWLVSCLTALVFVTYAAQKPLTNVESFPSWMRGFWRWSFLLLIPPLIILLVAIGRRVEDYGLTAPRVSLIILTIWALLICAFYFQPQKRSLYFIPFSLLIVAMLTLIGPLSPHFVSFYSQKQEFKELVERHGGQVVNNEYQWTKPLAEKSAHRVKAIVRYFCDTFGADRVFEVTGLSMPSAEALNDPHACRNWGHGKTLLEQVSQKLHLDMPTQPSAPELLSAYVEDNTSYYVSPSLEQLDFKIFIYDGSQSSEGAGSLQFNFICCKPEIIWKQNKGKDITIDLRPLLKKEERQLYVRGSEGLLSLNALFIQGTESNGDLVLTQELRMRAILMKNGEKVLLKTK